MMPNVLGCIKLAFFGKHFLMMHKNAVTPKQDCESKLKEYYYRKTGFSK